MTLHPIVIWKKINNQMNKLFDYLIKVIVVF